MRERERGQILIVFAGGLIAFLAIAALVLDLGSAYAANRRFRSVADAASLAGAQDLQVSGTRTVTATERNRARGNAMRVVVDTLFGPGGALPACPGLSGQTYTADVVDCTLPGGQYHTTIKTPSPTCQSCLPARSVQVTVNEPGHMVSISAIFGQSTWNITATSVAGLTYARAYTLATLRPPKTGSPSDVRNIRIDGGSKVTVINGDVGTNANMDYGGTYPATGMFLDAGYGMYYYDPFNGPGWPTSPTAMPKLTTLIQDPMYPVPVKGVSPPVGAQDTVANCTPIAAALFADPGYKPFVPSTGTPLAPDMPNIQCWKPGVYTGSTFDNKNNNLAILEPGLYFFDNCMSINGSLIGGYAAASTGVALVFPEANNCFKNRTGGSVVALNAGTRFGLPSTGVTATAALDYSGNPVQTSQVPPVLMTVIVTPDRANCPVTPAFPTGCPGSPAYSTVSLAGGSALYLAGVQYAPSDNMTISGDAATGGYVGQIWAWTVKYTGGSNITQEGSNQANKGVIRIDTACSPGEPCTP